MRLEVSNREFCYECNRHVAMTVDIGDLGDQESGAQLCIDCLRAAVALLEEALAATNDRTIGPWEITVTFPSEIVNPRALDMLAALIHSEEEE